MVNGEKGSKCERQRGETELECEGEEARGRWIVSEMSLQGREAVTRTYAALLTCERPTLLPSPTSPILSPLSTSLL